MRRWSVLACGLCVALIGCGSGYGPAPTGVPNGDATLSATYSTCPLITSLSIQPLITSLGNTVELSAAAADQGRGLSFIWTAPNGDFDDATSQRTLYTCTVVGDQDIILLVTDGQCGDFAQTPVACVEK